MKRSMVLMAALLVLANVPFFGHAAAPDLTQPGVIKATDTSRTYNLGPTGMRGWIYIDYSGTGHGYSRGVDESMTDAQPYQVLVRVIGANTPAYGVFQVNDVILGVNTGSGNLPVPLFTNDTRKTIGRAIGAAEAGDGWMNFKVWRAGVTNDLSIRLSMQGVAYSATAPYDCPKSALILSNAITVLASRPINYGVPGSQIVGLSMLASGSTNFMPALQTFARSIVSNPESHEMWDWGYKGIFLSEYYLKTGDTNVLPVLTVILLNISHGTDRYGTTCHNKSYLKEDGSFNGTACGYGPVNNVALAVNIALVMGRKALNAAGMPVHSDIHAAIDRGLKYFNFFTHKGEIPYGEHHSWGPGGHGSNGKSGQAAMLFNQAGNQQEATEFWTRMTLAGYMGREYGHTGQGLSYLWEALGANIGGTNAMAAYISTIQWHLDLERRSNGSFVYDGAEQYGTSQANDYWAVGGGNTYAGEDPTAFYLLTFSTPLRQIYMTGRDANPATILSADRVTNAIWSALCYTNVFSMTMNQLVDALDEFDPNVRWWSALELSKRPGVELASIMSLVGSSNAWLRASACTVLGELKNTNSLAVLGQCLSDSNIDVRAHAGIALSKFGQSARTLIPTMLAAYANNATDPKVIDWRDPVQLANSMLLEALMGGSILYAGDDSTLASCTAAADRNLLYPVLREALRQPDSLPRYASAQFIARRLNFDDIQSLCQSLIECATTPVLADPMWCWGGRDYSIYALGKFLNPETVLVALAMQNPRWSAAGRGDVGGGASKAATDILSRFGDSVRWVLPTLEQHNKSMGPIPFLANTIKTISAATTSPVLTNLFPVARSQVVALTNTTAITLTGCSCRTNAVTFKNVSKPAHGSLTGTPPKLSYTPDEGYSGVDSFTFRVADQMTNSAPGTVSIIVGTAGTGIQGQYYDTLDFTSQKVTRVDSQINFDWGTGAPTNTMGSDTFSVRWIGQLLVPETGTYTFSILSSDGARLYVNGQRLIDDWTDHDKAWKDSEPIKLTAGQQAHVWLEYYQNTGDATAKLKWSGPSFAGPNGVIIGMEWLGAKLRKGRTPSATKSSLGAVVTNTHVYAFSKNVTAIRNTNQLIILSSTHANFRFPTLPKHGRLSGIPPSVTYTPDTKYVGTDSFTFQVTDGVSISAAATVSINVIYGNPVSYSWVNLDGVWSSAGNWKNTLNKVASPAAEGRPNCMLNFNRNGTYSVTNDLNRNFLLNRMNFGDAVTVEGNSICTTNNGPIMPEINLDSDKTITFKAPLTLGATTTLGGISGGQMIFNALISGPGGLVINKAGSLRFNNNANTYSGGTVINGSANVYGNDSALGTGSITLAGGLHTDNATFTNRLILSGGTIYSHNGFGVRFSGPCTLTANSTLDSTDGNGGQIQMKGNIDGMGGFVKRGGSAAFSATNTYTGLTLVESGWLIYSQASAVSSSPLSINTGAKVALNYTGTRNIASLTLGGVVQPDGTYGSTASPATFKNDAFFAGTGTVTCGTGQRPSPLPMPAKTHPAR